MTDETRAVAAAFNERAANYATSHWHRQHGKSGAEICAQLKDPKRNGGRDAVALLEHLRHDASLNGFIPRAWHPGAGRTTPPGTFEEHVKDMAMWGAAGQPCPK